MLCQVQREHCRYSITSDEDPCFKKNQFDDKHDEHGQMVALSAIPVALKIQEIESASAEDEALQAVQSCLISGNWGKAPKPHVWVCNELTYIGRVMCEQES